MDYEQMSTRELQEECRRRGLPSGRAKTELVERLTEHDTEAADAPAMPQAPAPNAPLPSVSPGDRAHSVPAPVVQRLQFPAGPEGPDEEEHLAYRQAVIQAALKAGRIPRGDAYRVGTAGGYEVYEVRLRQVTA